MFIEQFPSLQRTHFQLSRLDDNHLSQDQSVLKLSFFDQCEFLRLSAYFQHASEKNKKNVALTAFSNNLQLIRNFVVRGDYGDFDRGCACGIHFGPYYMLVNTKRMKQFMGRSKSCINGCFHKIGYRTAKLSSETNPIFSDFYCRTQKDLPQPRQWCVKIADSTNQPPTEPHSDNEIEIRDRNLDISSSPPFMDIKSLLNRKAESI